ncbi:e53ef176-0f4d-42d4-a362-6404a89fdbb4 [Sclerotinia trifoliorum]|uniref:E53ef176-0f4d-42d4-a362-6404a89fdbb4 n=1 Tax=Sclerotinia trifoliorum TaxID=28548 RepID=A0A8H2ZJS0_9HELO|nr:e53ef176-0f4d-42d4-a362-6404a89fdbb4 [Sclerotinia trifoliorum]
MRKSGLLSKRKFPAIPGKARAFALDHPEITTNTFLHPGEGTGEVFGDFMLPCQTIELPEAESENESSIKLCHVTLVSFLTDVGEISLLLLDNQPGERTGAQFQATSYQGVLANALKNLPEEKKQWKPSRNHDPASTVADQIFDAAQSPGGTLFWDYLAEIIADIVLRKGRFALDEVIGHAGSLLMTKLIKHLNFLGLTLSAKAKGYTELFVWGQLLEEGFGTKAKSENGTGDDEGDGAASAASSRFLLAFSIIAAIFSMGGNFQPGGDQFFIFWIIAIPVCMLTTALIYADSIRRMTLEQFAQTYGPTAVKEEPDDLVASSISDSEIISYKAGIRERLVSHIPGPWNRSRRATSSSSVGYTDSSTSFELDSASSPQLPLDLSVDGDLLVGKKKMEPRSWSWRFWRRNHLNKSWDLEEGVNFVRSDRAGGSYHNVLERIFLGNPLAEPPSDDHPPIAGPAPPEIPSTSPPSPIPAPSLNPSIPDPADIPLPRSPDSTSEDWRELGTSEIIRHEISRTPESANSDYATDRERLSLERRMKKMMNGG